MQSRYYFIPLVLLLLTRAQLVKADVPKVVTAPKPGWLSVPKNYNVKPSPRDVQNGAYDDFVEEQINVDLQQNYNHVVTQIVSESGVQDNSEISVTFDPSYQKLVFHQITVWRNGKPLSRLNTSAFKMVPEETELDKFIYNGTYTATCILDDIRKGDKIEYAYTLTGRNPIFGGKYCNTIYLQGSHLIQHQYTVLVYNTGRKLNFKPFNLRSLPRINAANNQTRYAWEDFKVPGASSNKFEPDWFNTYARVQVSEFKNWSEVINWGMKINPIETQFSGELADSINYLKNKFGSDKEKFFRAAVSMVQDQVRYMGIETGRYSHKANSPLKVFSQRYGDCKDKSLLLASILNAGGIEAHMVLVNTQLLDKLSTLIPSPVLFDHAVVVAIINDKMVWVDATMALQRGTGLNLFFPPYGDGLILKKGQDGLTEIKPGKFGHIQCDQTFNIKDEYAPVYLTVKTTFTLNEADATRSHLASAGFAKTEKNYLDYYAKTYSKIELADSLKVNDDQEKNVFTTFESYRINGFFKKDTLNGKFYADTYVDYITDELPDLDSRISTPVSVTYPYNVDCKTTIRMGDGWDVQDEKYTIARPGYDFSSSKIAKGSELTLTYHFNYLNDFISAKEVPQFITDLKELKDNQLAYSFYYIPDITRVPFKTNILMVIIALVSSGLFVFWMQYNYRLPTTNNPEFNTGRVPSLGGWLIVLMLILFVSALNSLKYLVDEHYFSLAKWEMFNTGEAGLVHKSMLIFQCTGYVVIILYSFYCLFVVFKRRDIAPYYLKIYFIVTVLFTTLDYLLRLYFKMGNNTGITDLLMDIIIAGIWTYYLNVSTRVQDTFVIPYYG